MLVPVNREVSSPCNGFCNFDSKIGLCLGCFRKMSEIMEWQNFDDNQKRIVLQRVMHRKEKYKHKIRDN